MMMTKGTRDESKESSSVRAGKAGRTPILLTWQGSQSGLITTVLYLREPQGRVINPRPDHH